MKSQESQGRAWGKRNGYTIRRVFRENLSAYKAGVKRPEFDEAVQAKAVDRDAGKWLGTPPDGLKVTKKAS
ncbi:hypothetical protein ACIOJE_21910 [Kitasatospora sp. NPDC087861]|uniref:hypothetical protein n=1 Tax=Kitasatospora sp. NPDC087861 TaxID=3364070 RepID=UPI00380D28D4